MRDADKNIEALTGELEQLQRLYDHRRAAAAQIRTALWAMSSSEDIGAFLKMFFQVTQELCPALTACSATVLSTAGDEGTAYWFTRQSIKKFTIGAEDLAGSPVERAWRRREIVYRPDLQREDAYGEIALFGPASSVRCILDLPYERGTLAVNSSQPDAFSAADIEMFQETTSLLSEAFSRLDDLETLATKEAQLLESQKIEALGRLTAGISHNFNNALLGIMGNVELALQTASDEQRPLLQEADRAAQRAADIVDQLMIYAHQGEPVAHEPVSMHPLAERVTNICRNIFDRKIAITLESRARPTVEGHAGQLEQALLNLCINARDALAHGAVELPQLHIAVDQTDVENPPTNAAHSGPFVRIDVRDNGAGMDAETRARIFDPFFTTKDIGKGTGLGLSTTQGIAHQHLGWIQCRSEPGRGTTFTLFLPAHTAPVPQERCEESGEDDRGGSETILVVDDEEGIRHVLTHLLERNGYAVLAGRDGGEALKIFRSNRDAISLVLLDQSMPHMSGSEVLDELRAIDPDVKVIILTGYAVERNHFPGARDLIRKPVRLQELAHKVRQILDE